MRTSLEPTEQEKVELWRLQVLVKAGYPFRLAACIASSSADLHLAASLVRDGCEPRLAAKILL
jgi:hypothetical protein